MLFKLFALQLYLGLFVLIVWRFEHNLYTSHFGEDFDP